jgi:hypothetical protein
MIRGKWQYKFYGFGSNKNKRQTAKGEERENANGEAAREQNRGTSSE